MWVGVGGGGTLIFSHIPRLRLFWGLKISNGDTFGGFQKQEYSFGYEDFVDIFGGSSQKLGYIKGSYLCILGPF